MASDMRKAIRRLIDAMEKAEEVGIADHFDCDDEGGKWWYNAIKYGEKVLRDNPE